MSFIERFTAPQWVQSIALLAALAGIATWSSLLLMSAESRNPDLSPSLSAAHSDNPALQWFSNQPAPVEIKVSGVMAGSRGAVAILSLNGGAPRSFLLGERVSPRVTVVAIEGDAVVIERGTQRTRVLLDKLPEAAGLPILTRE
ncbi:MULTISPECIES: type II secretion system protein N [unclassified Pseudomonas]|uniref:type II secretion system protein N n=1 Tax=unclassified Pseudomonas TaxID=196821 RepID=UPI002AC8C9F3|nr:MULTISPECIES: type II secretion system protein N [unclassified Pseudomonas]MEB0048384.1 type II secretion system protein N [Pseudomonas sp. Dout3]MEB0097560.1 type II secretion system protein N [Pseudomonas sp. DC1.2]WPX56750.1 type II secretion system protein N [Pseudomonas sp. DC1.2]